MSDAHDRQLINNNFLINTYHAYLNHLHSLQYMHGSLHRCDSRVDGLQNILELNAPSHHFAPLISCSYWLETFSLYYNYCYYVLYYPMSADINYKCLNLSSGVHVEISRVNCHRHIMSFFDLFSTSHYIIIIWFSLKFYLTHSRFIR